MEFQRYARLFVALATLMAFMSYGHVAASQTVDPTTLNPPPPPEFNPVCRVVGHTTSCIITFSDPPVVGEDTGIHCGSGTQQFEVLATYGRSVDGKRSYDSGRNLTQRHYREDFVGTFANSVTGQVLTFVQSDTIIHDLSVPANINQEPSALPGGSACRYHTAAPCW